jgi:16S rRNA (guanine966-N2)-methyltransferase
VREALFSILGPLDGARVLDLYAGSGALGIEAISRGAEHATFVECERSALACIRENIEALALAAQTSVLPVRVESASSKLLAGETRFDLVFCDPPWKDGARAALALGTLGPVLPATARVLLEHPARQRPAVEGFTLTDERSWGDTGLSIFDRASLV